ncbi:MAG: hydroxymethylbilane synthase [Legionellaceae bacterium]|nr:hydroxymethylbilane synthase [Legionellaceae bacterium]
MITIATRQSPLALKQTDIVIDALRTHYPELSINIQPMTTQGDRQLDQSLAKIGGKGLFIKELEKALLDGSAELAVHSMKDMPMELHPELEMMSVLPRAEVRDALVCNQYSSLSELPANAVVGTSSLRRAAQLKAWRPDLNVKPLRGNVNTRLNKLDNNEFDAIILAAAGLQRLSLQNRIGELLPTEKMLPAAAQGVLCVEFRKNNTALKNQLASIHHPDVECCVLAERAIVNALQASCHTPVGTLATHLPDDSLMLQSMVGMPDGSHIITASATGQINQAEQLAQIVSQQLNEQGAQRILHLGK